MGIGVNDKIKILQKTAKDNLYKVRVDRPESGGDFPVDVPTKLSELINDADYTTNQEVSTTYTPQTQFINATNRISDLEADHVSVNELEATIADIGELRTGKADVEDLTAIRADIGDLQADKADITDLQANYAHITNGVIDNADINHADVIGLTANYAQINLANVNNAWLTNGTIKNGAIGNAMINDVSANKLTAGTIDASKIDVTNLNASNLTVGTINGQRIGNASISLDKLSEEVPTKEYLDSVKENLEGQIEGQIESFTGSAVPTANNYPASGWSDYKTKHAHAGDLYYVVNSALTEDGYCYRYSEDENQNFSWILIKDSDVTKAIRELNDVKGDITGIKAFDTQISSWKTDTDDEITSIKARTSTLETDIGTKVNTSTFNALSQTVDANSSNITSLSNRVDTKADNSTVTTLSNTVNSVQQTANANSASISNLTTTVSNNKTAIENRASAIEQDLSGFKTTVSSTYNTKTEFNNYKTSNDTAVAAAKKAGDDAQDSVDTLTDDLVNGQTDYFLLTTNGESVQNAKTKEVKTASGQLVSINDSTGDDAISLKTTIEPIQDLHGYDSPWVGGAGVNLFDIDRTEGTLTDRGPNVARSFDVGKFYVGFSANNYYLTTTVNSYSLVNNGVKVNAANRPYGIAFPMAVLAGTNYYVSYTQAPNQEYRVGFFDADGNYLGDSGARTQPSYFTPPTSTATAVIVFTCTSAGENTDVTYANIQVEIGTSSSTWTPYSNICPIYGRTGQTVMTFGKNLCSGINSYNANNRMTSAIWLKGSIKYTFSFENAVNANGLYVRSGATISASAPTIATVYNAKKITFTAPKDNYYFFQMLKSGNGWATDPTNGQLEIGETATAYEPYAGSTYTRAFVDGQGNELTVYGGEDEIVGGALTVKTALVDLGTLSWYVADASNNIFRCTPSGMKTPATTSDRNKGIISSAFKPSSTLTLNANMENCGMLNVGGILYVRDISYNDAATFKTFVSGVQLCYELATPVTYQLAPNEVETLIGTNHVWSDAGEVTVEYVAENAAEWTTEKQEPTKYSPYVWWKHKQEFTDSEDDYESEPTIFNTYPKDLDDQVGTIEKTVVKQSDFDVTIDEIRGSVSNVETTAKSYTDGKISQEVTDRNTAISQTANAINLSVSQNYSTKTDLDNVETRVDTLENFKSEFTVTPSAISSEVQATQNGQTLVSRINQTADTVKIQAKHVEIDGTATFNAIKSSTDAAYDAKGSASTAKAEAIAQIPTDISDLNNDSGYQTASQVSAAVTNGITGKADKTVAIKRTQRIYYRSKVNTAPAKPTAWITLATNKYNDTATVGNAGWSTKITPIASGTGASVTKYLYLFTCEQSQKADDSTPTCTDVLLDENTTVIDGGTIITNSITANQINTSTIKVGDLNNDVGYITESEAGMWYTGTAITGTSTTATIFSGSGITEAHIGDMYLNTSNSNVYRCTVGGAATVARWVYTGNIKGANGTNGTNGVDGTTFTPTVDANGNISWTNDGGKTNPTSRNIKGSDGSDGTTFTPSVDSNGNISWTNDGGKTNPTSRNITGPTGNGIQSIQLLSTSGRTKTYRINYTNGSHYDYTVTDGAPGADTSSQYMSFDSTNGLKIYSGPKSDSSYVKNYMQILSTEQRMVSDNNELAKFGNQYLSIGYGNTVGNQNSFAFGRLLTAKSNQFIVGQDGSLSDSYIFGVVWGAIPLLAVNSNGVQSTGFYRNSTRLGTLKEPAASSTDINKDGEWHEGGPTITLDAPGTWIITASATIPSTGSSGIRKGIQLYDKTNSAVIAGTTNHGYSAISAQITLNTTGLISVSSALGTNVRCRGWLGTTASSKVSFTFNIKAAYLG